jgi:phasin family protein
MNDEFFSKMLGNFQTFPIPSLRANELCINYLEKLMDLQISSLRFYVDLGIAQLKEAAAIKNIEDIQTYFNNQHEVMSSLSEKIMSDARLMADLSADFRADFDELAQVTSAGVVAKAD